MRIVKLDIAGWMPFKERVKLELPVGPIAIVGMHAGDERRSNRSGKTAFLEAITWCMFGVHRKRLDDQIINWTCEECMVEVWTETLRIVRTRKRGKSTQLQAYYQGAITVGETAQQLINRVLGITEEDYLATSCFKQGDVDAIIRRTSGERLTLVSEWLQQNKWIRAKEIQAGKARAANKLLEDKRMARKLEGTHVLTDGIVAALKNELVRLDETATSSDSKMKKLEEQLAEHSRVKQQAVLLDELERLRSEATALKAQLGQRGAVNVELEGLLNFERKAHIAADQASSALAEVKQVRAGNFNGVCPVMCEKCPVSEQVIEVVTRSSELLDSRTRDERLARHDLSLSRDKIRNTKEKVRELDRAAEHYKWCLERGKEVAAQITMTREEIAAWPNTELASKELEALRTQFGSTSNRIGEIKALLDASEQAEARCRELDGEVKKAETASQVSFLALKAISSVPAKLAAQQLLNLEEEVNGLLSGSGISLRFSWTRELADKAPVCGECGHVFVSKRGEECPDCNAPRGKKLANELELLCDDGSGVEEDVRYSSGGTRAIAGAAIRLGASAMLRQLRSTQISWAVVDEPFGQLDMENREQLARTFAGMLGSVGLEQALVVSHDPALLGALPNRIVIDKTGSSSTLRLE